MENDKNIELYMKLQPLIMQDAKRAASELFDSQQYKVADVPFHTHNGTDATRISYDDLTDKIIPITITIPGLQAATATNYGVFFTAYTACLVIGATEVHQTAGTDGSAVTLQIEKLTGTQAPDAGTVLLTSAFNLKGTANTVQTGTTVTSSDASLRNLTTFLAVGDRLCLKDVGTLTAVANVTVVIKLLLIP